MDWAVATDSNDSFLYKVAGGYSNREYHLTSYNTITPGVSTRLLLRWKRSLATDRFRVLASTDRITFTEVWGASGSSDWEESAVSLADYAGQAIYLRLEYQTGSYYLNGGIWIDTIWLQDVENPELRNQPLLLTTLTDLPTSGTLTLATVVEDQANAQHRRSPPFTLIVNQLFTYRVEIDNTATITGYHGSSAVVEIPAELDGKVVTGVASGAFVGTTLKNVVVPASVTMLETGAFNSATTLQGIMFTGAPPSAPNGSLTAGATVYYLSGNQGWGSTFAGRTTRLWNPAVLPGSSFGIQSGNFGFTITGTPYIPVQVQATDTLLTPTWQILTNTVLSPTGTATFTDPASPPPPSRFYRFAWPPLDQ